jgi:hypothetical protein
VKDKSLMFGNTEDDNWFHKNDPHTKQLRDVTNRILKCFTCNTRILDVKDAWVEADFHYDSLGNIDGFVNFRIIHDRPHSPIATCHSGTDGPTNLPDSDWPLTWFLDKKEASDWDFNVELLITKECKSGRDIGFLRTLLSTFTSKQPKVQLPAHFGEYSAMTKSLRFDVMKRDKFKCQLCGRTAKDGVRLEVDHKTPRAKGGSNQMSNLWTLCFDCNRGKQTKIISPQDTSDSWAENLFKSLGIPPNDH